MNERHFLSGNDGTLECRGDLLTRVLSGAASETERCSFDAHLKVCESCQLSHDLLGDFEKVGAFSDDSERVAELAARALLAHKSARLLAPAPRRRSVTVRVALAALALGGAAAAATFFAPRTAERAPPTGLVKSPGSSMLGEGARSNATSRVAQAKAPQGPSIDATSQTQTSETKPGSRSRNLPPGSTLLPPASTQTTADTAEELFKSANQARRQGKSAEAVRRYSDLQQRFSGSSEANLSRISLGGLLLKNGQAAAALTQFERYLAQGGQGPLTAEALYGRGRALQKLGRKNEETQNWQRLLKSYPASPYSFEARRRIQALR